MCVDPPIRIKGGRMFRSQLGCCVFAGVCERKRVLCAYVRARRCVRSSVEGGSTRGLSCNHRGEFTGPCHLAVSTSHRPQLVNPPSEFRQTCAAYPSNTVAACVLSCLNRSLHPFRLFVYNSTRCYASVAVRKTFVFLYELVEFERFDSQFSNKLFSRE